MRIQNYRNYGIATTITIIICASVVIGAGADKRKLLPPPIKIGKMSVEEVIAKRRSCRDFTKQPMSIEQIGQLCWAGQGITDRSRGFRTSPSAGALFPIELYIVTAQGVDHYHPKKHSLERHLTGDYRLPLQKAGLDQESIGQAPVCFVITAVIERSARKYHQRAEQYCIQETGHVAQNILLQATALELAGVPIGGFDEDQAAAALKLPKNQRVLYLLPIGHPK